ncbi:glutaminase domain-containing protein [uncultured Fibrella sp.]|uniref:glutaminase family protein n=1 Tax=uncultured Fibrella sp. TaxID=1284596 RepID=UPI0035C95832
MDLHKGLLQPESRLADRLERPLVGAASAALNPPATPLITVDPYTSIWSFGDQLHQQPTRHWTGRPHALNGLLRVDGQVYRFMGNPTFVGNTVVQAGRRTPYEARYRTDAPGTNAWMQPGFDDSQWQTGQAPFGSRPTDRTPWTSQHIWVRREVMLDRVPKGRLLVSAAYTDNYELFINGERVAGASGVAPNYDLTTVDRPIAELLRPGRNVIAFHSQNLAGPGFVDLSLLQERTMDFKTATQTGKQLSATQSAYSFDAGGVELTVTFMAPLLLNNLDVLSRPVQYITYRVRSKDGQPHTVELYQDAASDIAVDHPGQPVTWRRGRTESGRSGQRPVLNWMRVGTAGQPVLGTKGDNVRIDWGYLYVAAPVSDEAAQHATSHRIGTLAGSVNQFEREGMVSDIRVGGRPNMITDSAVVLATSFNFGTVTKKATERHLLIGYDDVKSIEYVGKPLNAWWRRYGNTTIEQALQDAETDYPTLRTTCDAFDKELYGDAVKAGGSTYADLCVLAYRQAISAHKLVAGSASGGGAAQPLFFSKENFSNGSIGTVDVTYPSAPLFLKYNPTLLKGMMEPIFEYSESGRWTKPFAAHDVGTYPIANGQTYHEDMPVEECGNMLILSAALAHVEGNANYARRHWSVLTTWVTYLREHGFDPTNQLCTDDFAGHLARNANLSIKAIMGIASYGYLAGKLGDRFTEATYLTLARDLAGRWMALAKDPADDHYMLAFEAPGTWSQKYNLVWDKLLGLNIFPKQVAEQELAFYLTKQQPFGLPLDSRRTYTKSDWIVWTATLADKPEDFEALIRPILRFATESPDRVPLNDWHETTNGYKVGFQARSVVGGYFIKMLE